MPSRALTSLGRVFLGCLLSSSLLVATGSIVHAQSVTGTLLGTVRDASGAVLSGASVTIVNQGTGLTRTVTADAQGEYTVPALPTGTYTVMAEQAGFKTVALSDVQLGVDQRLRIDLSLELGAVSETVTIRAETPLVQTASSELGTTVQAEQIRTLPLNGRNFVSLTRTVPGVLRGVPGSNIDGAGSLSEKLPCRISSEGTVDRNVCPCDSRCP